MQIQKTGSDFVLSPSHSSESSSDMLGLESSRAQHSPLFAQQQFPIDSAIMDPFSYLDDFHSLSQSQDPARSLPHSFYDTPSIASGPSIASASSSAMGSPNSGAANAFPEGWIDTNHGLGLPPSVINDLPSEYNQIGSAVDPDSAFATEKFPNSYVGE
ncbi:hypothetical protein VTN96DRAFT_6315 [Rasamsonia emersonii]